ncbi:Protein of unknown function [Chitinophaga costaii]|uniref:DUF4876 domain-containing protein n=1 Tax=Chitinophaga costaii TaxID=1335309 RepID=A0A1C4FYT9_9BACT|nr:DUF4876 domain-containing protein [Chitinophaga costaii]PUZ20936.1 DUF4876 domain-containing protein [Chitinophaga costaii]SCC61149.1 Protein of unknown function [Chitinophaga costaii]
MKRFIPIALALLLAILFQVACKKSDLKPSVPPINVIVKVAYDSAGGSYDFPLTGISVVVKNTVTGNTITQQTDNTGLGIFNSISAGIYDVQATIAIPRATYESVTGLTSDKDSVVFNAALSNLTLNATTNNTLSLKLALGKIGDWVIKQIYYAGSNTQNGALYRDQFIEIYNNANQVLYADSLYIAQLSGNNTGTAKTDLTKGYYLSDASDPLYKQYDWSKSIGISPATDGANRNFVYTKTLFRIPGNGTQYPIQPGASFVIAATAQNHKAPFVGADGVAISVKDPSLTVDLSGADFEVYLGDVISNALSSDVDNLNVPNLLVNDAGGNRDLILDNPGRDAIVIFKTTAHLPLLSKAGTDVGDASTYKKYPDPSVTTISNTTSVFYQVPNAAIIDAVQMQNPSPSSSQRVPRKLVSTLDAGAANVPDGAYSSESIIRKTAKTVGTRVILMDTNNATNDFDYLPKALPGIFKN